MLNREEKCPIYIPPEVPKVPVPSTERDFRIVQSIYEYDGVLTDDQIKLMENMGLGPFNTRMQVLVEHCYIHRMAKWKREQYTFSAYWLAERGARYVAGLAGNESEWRDYCFKTSRKWKGMRNPRFDNLIHDTRINDYRLMVERSCAHNPDLELRQWVKESIFKADPDRVIYRNRKNREHKRNFIPDGFYIVDDMRNRHRYRLLLELDNGVKDGNKMLDEKLLIGASYVSSDLYQRRFSTKQGWFTYVCNNKDRAELLKKYTEEYQPTMAQFFFFTTFELVASVTDVLSAPIWLQGGVASLVPVIRT